MSLDWLIDRFAENPDKIAFIDKGRRVSYGELASLVSGFQQDLQQRAVLPGHRVMIFGDYTPESFALILALACNGNIIIPFTRESVVELDAALSICGCEWIFEWQREAILPCLRPHPVDCDNELLRSYMEQNKAGIILFSSGSTGKPKGILHDFNQVAKKFLKQRSPVTAVPFLMFDHFGGLNTVLAITASLGTVVSMADRSVEQICQAIETYNVTLLPTTPSFLNLMMVANAHKTWDLSSLNRITYGTEVMPQTTLNRLRQAFPKVEFQQTYGLSEVGVLGSRSRDDGSLWMSLGGSGFETKVVDDVLWIKSDFAMAGYLNAPSAFDDEGWFNTQDKVEVDGPYFRVIGRVTDLINVGGQKVYPAEVEEAILTLDNVMDVVVYGESNSLLGHIVVAKVVTSQPEPASLLKARIRAGCKERLAPFKIPTKVITVEGDLHTSRFKKSRC